MAIYGTFVSFRLHFLVLGLACGYLTVCCDELGVDMNIMTLKFNSETSAWLGDFADKTETIIGHFTLVGIIYLTVRSRSNVS